MFQDQVFCFTPKGEVIKLPRGATPIDFAYAIHTRGGDSCLWVLWLMGKEFLYGQN